MRHSSILLVAALLFASCDTSPLASYKTLNGIAYSTAEAQALGLEVEAVIGATFGTGFWTATQSSSASLPWSTIADEISSSWANWGMRDMSSEPRVAWDNSPTYSREELTQGTWNTSYEAIAQLNTALALFDEGLEIGEEGADTERAKAFALFVRGLLHGNIAMRFDQGYVLTDPVESSGEIPLLHSYMDLLAAARSDLESAVDIALNNQFVLPTTWLQVDMDNTQFAALARSYLMRYLANSARSPSERAAVDWNEIVTLHDGSVSEDFAPLGNDNGDIVWWDAMKFYGQEHRTWARADYRTIGPADESGGYAAWLATPVSNRTLFQGFTSTDRRIVGPRSDNGAGCQGIGDADCSGTDFEFVAVAGPFPSSRGTYHYSTHTHRRYAYYHENNSNGLMPTLLEAEMDLLKAEGLLRTGGATSEVADLINGTRVGRGQLAPATGSNSAGAPSDAQSHLPDASLWAMLKHEMRIETYATAGGLAYYLDRGWGDLVSGTPVHFPVPPPDLELLYESNYTFGGVGGIGAAPKSMQRWSDKARRPK